MSSATLSPAFLCKILQLRGCDELDAAVLLGKKEELLAALGDVPDGTHVALDCAGTQRFSAGFVAILLAMAEVVHGKSARLGCINVSPAAAESLRSHPEGIRVRICYETANLAYGQE